MRRSAAAGAILAYGRNGPRQFGQARLRPEPSQAASMADAVRHCRGIASDVDAAAFALLQFGPLEQKQRLIHTFDSDFPAVSPLSRLIASNMAEDLVRHAASSTAPQWFARPGTAAWLTLSRIAWCVGPLQAPGGLSGMALPVHAERGQAGVLMLLGEAIAADEAAICAAHASAFALFSAVSRLKSADGGAVPSISKRELECLTLTANGLTSEDIAAELGLSVHTANQYLTNTTQKLNAVNRMHAVAKALRLGLIE